MLASSSLEMQSNRFLQTVADIAIVEADLQSPLLKDFHTRPRTLEDAIV